MKRSDYKLELCGNDAVIIIYLKRNVGRFAVMFREARFNETVVPFYVRLETSKALPKYIFEEAKQMLENIELK